MWLYICHVACDHTSADDLLCGVLNLENSFADHRSCFPYYGRNINNTLRMLSLHSLTDSATCQTTVSKTVKRIWYADSKEKIIRKITCWDLSPLHQSPSLTKQTLERRASTQYLKGLKKRKQMMKRRDKWDKTRKLVVVNKYDSVSSFAIEWDGLGGQGNISMCWPFLFLRQFFCSIFFSHQEVDTKGLLLSQIFNQRHHDLIYKNKLTIPGILLLLSCHNLSCHESHNSILLIWDEDIGYLLNIMINDTSKCCMLVDLNARGSFF